MGMTCESDSLLMSFHIKNVDSERRNGQYQCCPLASVAESTPSLGMCDTFDSAVVGADFNSNHMDALTNDGARVDCGDHGVLQSVKMVSHGWSAFKFRYTCCTVAAEPVVAGSPLQCGTDEVGPTNSKLTGQWVPIAYSNSDWDVDYTVGYSTTSSDLDGSSVKKAFGSAHSVSAAMTVHVSPFGPLIPILGKKTGHFESSISTESTLSEESSREVAHSVERIIDQAKSTTKRFQMQQKPDFSQSQLWQWKAFLDSPCGGATVLTEHLATTPSLQQAPCCAPTSRLRYSWHQDGNTSKPLLTEDGHDYRLCAFNEIFRDPSTGAPINGCTVRPPRPLPQRTWVHFAHIGITNAALQTSSFNSFGSEGGDLWWYSCSDVEAAAGPGAVMKMVLAEGNGDPSTVDYFRPTGDNTLCDMLASGSKHQWSNDLATWYTPSYHPDHMGGSASNWARTNVAGDNREHLPFWGSGVGVAASGCCYHKADGSQPTWSRPFDLFIHA